MLFPFGSKASKVGNCTSYLCIHDMLNACLIINLNPTSGFSPAFFPIKIDSVHTHMIRELQTVSMEIKIEKIIVEIFENFSVKLIVFQVVIDGVAHIVQANITAENGFVHVIDKVRKQLL